MSFEETLRTIVREEVRAALSELRTQTSAPATAMEGQKLPVVQAAALYGPSPSTIAKWMKAGKLTRYGKGRSTRVDVAELLRALREEGERHTKALSESEIEARVEAELRRRH